MTVYVWIVFSMVVTFANMFAFRNATLGRWRWISLGMAIVSSIAAGLFVIVAIGNLVNGCGPWAPSEVEFHQGMTLCPGQTANGFIKLPDVE